MKAVEPELPVIVVPNVLLTVLAAMVKGAGVTVLVTIAILAVVAPVLLNTILPE